MRLGFLPHVLVLLFVGISGMKGQGIIVKGQVLGDGQALPLASVQVLPDIYVGVTNMEGEFELKDLREGEIYTVEISYVGYKSIQSEFTASKETKSLIFNLENSGFYLNELVVSGTRTSKRRLESAVAVNVLNGSAFELTQSGTLSEGMCFQPGLRVETDCQTCNYTQLRMNGLAGSYSQILIDSRPIFTSIMSLYSLEQIPASQIERVEVVRGGGSVLFGANAIAGSVNVITKVPNKNQWSIKQSFNRINGQSNDRTFSANATIISDDRNSGFSVYANDRNREMYDHNADGYSELSAIRTTSFGTKAFWQLSADSRIDLNAWKIHSFRRGGNAFDLPADQADQAEERDHNILVAGLEYNYSPKAKPYWASLYTSYQHTTRRHYTGVDQSDGWGNTDSKTLVSGIQLNRKWKYSSFTNTMSLGYEFQLDDTYDEIKAYNFLIDQRVQLGGLYLQSDMDLGKRWSFVLGLRNNWHTNLDGSRLTPRLNVLYKVNNQHQFRSSWSQGFKPAQAFETDMHIAFAGGGISRIELADNLKEETSTAYNLSWDFNKSTVKTIYGFTLSAFHTTLHDAFILEELGTDSLGNQVLQRLNGGESTVRGLSAEVRWNYDQKWQIESGLTVQRSEYDNSVKWSESIEGERRFLRTPDEYGFLTLSLFPEQRFSGSVSGVYTGSMLVPHFGGAPEQAEDELYVSENFYELNLKFDYTYNHPKSNIDLVFSAGVQNLLNQYQSNFDSGAYRDSNFVYGPARPRTYFFTVKLGSSK